MQRHNGIFLSGFSFTVDNSCTTNCSPSVEYSCFVAPQHGLSTFWTYRGKRRPNLLWTKILFADLSTAKYPCFKIAKHLELKIKRMHKNAKSGDYICRGIPCAAGSTPPSGSQDRISSKKDAVHHTKIFFLFAIFMEEISKKTPCDEILNVG